MIGTDPSGTPALPGTSSARPAVAALGNSSLYPSLQPLLLGTVARHLGGQRLGDDRHPVIIADQHVAGDDRHVAAADRALQVAAGMSGNACRRRRPRTPDREPGPRDTHRVPHGPVGHHRRDPALFQPRPECHQHPAISIGPGIDG